MKNLKESKSWILYTMNNVYKIFSLHINKRIMFRLIQLWYIGRYRSPEIQTSSKYYFQNLDIGYTSKTTQKLDQASLNIAHISNFIQFV